MAQETDGREPVHEMAGGSVIQAGVGKCARRPGGDQLTLSAQMRLPAEGGLPARQLDGAGQDSNVRDSHSTRGRSSRQSSRIVSPTSAVATMGSSPYSCRAASDLWRSSSIRGWSAG